MSANGNQGNVLTEERDKMENDKKSELIQKRIDEAFAIEAQDAKEAGTTGYMARAFVQATIPHRRVEGIEFKRTNGNFTLIIVANSDVGLPFGSVPRLELAWITTEAVRTKTREINLGNSMSAFMRQLGLNTTGGKRGDIRRLKKQTESLFASHISCTYNNNVKGQWGIKNVVIASNAVLWWDPISPDQLSTFNSVVKLNQDFFDEIITRPVIVDMRVLKFLKQSPLALDAYTWFTYRMSYLKEKSKPIPWEFLQLQFGSGYSNNPHGTRNFKAHFLRELKKIKLVYKDLKLDLEPDGLILYPSPTHILKSE